MDLFRMAIAAVVAIVVGVPLILATRHMRPAGEKEWQEAARAGRVTTGTLTDKVFLPPDMASSDSKMRAVRWRVRYDYTVNGVQYAYFCTLKAPVPEQVDLYYPEGQPDRAALQSAMMRRRGLAYTLWALAPVAIWIVVYWALPIFGIFEA